MLLQIPGSAIAWRSGKGTGAAVDGERREPLPLSSLNGHGLGILGVTADRRPGGVSVRVTGEMDIATAPQLVATMRSLSRRDLQHVWLDLTGLTFIDASGLAALVQVKNARRRPGRSVDPARYPTFRPPAADHHRSEPRFHSRAESRLVPGSLASAGVSNARWGMT